ncbi:hypothetical protein GCM10023212_14700 [Luteolibacter yonseiensis]
MAGAGISAYSSYQQGKAQEAMGERNAKIAENAALNEAQVAAENAKREREKGRRQLAAIRGHMAGSGVQMSTGSSLDVIGDAASDLELAAMDLFRDSTARQMTYQNQSVTERWEGKQAGVAGKYSAMGTLLGGVSSTMRGVA